MMKKHNYTFGSCLAVFLFLVWQPYITPLPAFGQDNATEEAAPGQVETTESQITAIQKKIKAVSDKISAAKSMENPQSASRFKVSLEALNLRTTLLRETETIYQRQLAALTKQESLQKELTLLEENCKQGTDKTIDQKPPYSLDLYDYYLDQLSKSARQVDVVAQAIVVGKKTLHEASAGLKGAEKKLRALAESNNKDKASVEWLQLLADDEKELAQSLVDLQLINAGNDDLELKLAELKKNINQQNIDWLKGHLTFNEEELANHLAAIEERRKELEQRIDRLLREQHIAENKWLAAQRKVDPAQPLDEKKLVIDQAYLQAREAWRETYQHVISHNNSMLQLLNWESLLWQRRYTYLKGATPTVELKNWRKEARAEIEKLSRALILYQTHQHNVQVKIAATRIQLSRENIDPEARRHIDTSLQAQNKLGERNFEYLTVLQGAIELDQRLIEAIDDQLKEFNLGEQLAMVRATIESIWKYELFVVDAQGVTVGKIILAFMILIAGIILSGFFTRLIHRQLLVRLKISLSATAITEKLIYYSSLLVVTFIAMRSVNIPMTAFTFLGGAVAIGVGFGAQKLINNFISGFILMVEQPIKVGDLVQTDSGLGKIEDIGARCTRVLTFDNVHLLVPNSHFLEKNITNWTHNDNMVQAMVTVGIVYGSSTELAKEQLLQAAHAHGEILETPAPYVLFDDFGDNALLFTLFFWVMVDLVIDKKRIESDVRFIIDESFREANLVMAFPQRDVHLDTSSPLQISISKKAAKKNRDEENSSS
ncbi:MAG: mechanosensitive ion channel [Desulfobulbaceae bacterium]|nr:mechanosensitive ion channel [Desulfobulbaceae bacterium]